MPALVTHDMRAKVAIGTFGISLMAEPRLQIQYNDHRDYVIFTGQIEEPAPSIGLNVSRVYHNEFAQRQSFPGNVMQQLKGVFCNRLIVIIVGNHSAAGVGGENLCRFEMLMRERCLTAAGGTDENYERQFRYCDLHVR